MPSSKYKVVFKGLRKETQNRLSLTFSNIHVKIPKKKLAMVLLELKKLSEKSGAIVAFQNIELVQPIGFKTTPPSYNYYYVLLYTNKSEKIKTGFLIGNRKNEGDLLIGKWPFTEKEETLNSEEIDGQFLDLIQNSHQYQEICLIN